jgi:hypothetical protein
VTEDLRSNRLALVVLGVALACLEAAVSILEGHDELSRIARDLEDAIETEKKWLEARRTS